MKIDDLKIDELQHFASIAFREIDLQYMRKLEPEQRLEYINGMLNTSVGAYAVAGFRFRKLFKTIAATLADAFEGVGKSFRRISQ